METNTTSVLDMAMPPAPGTTSNPGTAFAPNAAPAAEALSAPSTFTIRDLHFAYDEGHVIFNGLNLDIHEGIITTFLGANGSGKSTLFNLMTKNLVPDRGAIFLRQGNIAQLRLRDFAKLVAIVHQNNTAPPDLTVRSLVGYGRFPYRSVVGMRQAAEEDERVVGWALETTGLTEYADRTVTGLSGGQRQRVWIAMALAQGSRVVLLDEPTTYLDIRYQLDILNLVMRLNREYGMTIVMVLHDMNQAIYYSDEVVALADGRVVGQGAPKDIITPELLKEVYSIDLQIKDVDGHPFVLNVGGKGALTGEGSIGRAHGAGSEGGAGERL